MKICILTHTFPRNSQDVAAAFMKEFADGLVLAGNKVVVLTPYDSLFERKGDLFKIYTYKYICPESWHILGYSRAMEKDIKLRKINFILLPFMVLFGTISLLKIVRKEKIEIINVHWIIPNGLICLLVSKITKVPYAITLPGTDAYLAFKYKLFGFVAGIIAKNASGIFSNSPWHLKRILDLGVNPKVSGVISYPTDIKNFKPTNKGVDALKRIHKIRKNDIVILAVGRLVYKKGFKYLIKAMTKINKKYNFVKLLIGGDGDLKQELSDLIKNLNLEKNVYLIGTIKRGEINRYYNLADIMVAPSIVDKEGNVDGGPVSALESMACAKPQILTNVLGMASVLEDGKNGFVVRQKNVKDLENAILKLIQSPSLRKRMGKANRILVKQKLTNKKIGAIYSKSFENILTS